MGTARIVCRLLNESLTKLLSLTDIQHSAIIIYDNLDATGKLTNSHALLSAASGTYLFLLFVEIVNDDTNEQVESEE